MTKKLDMNLIAASIVLAMQKAYNDVQAADPFGRKGEDLVNDMGSSAKGLDYDTILKNAGLEIERADLDTAIKAFDVLMSMTGTIQEKIVNDEPNAYEYTGTAYDVDLANEIHKQLNALYVKSTPEIGEPMPASATATPTTASPVEAVKLTADFANGINALLQVGTKGKYSDINEVLKLLAEKSEEAQSLNTEIIRLATAAARPVIPTSGTDATSVAAGPLSFEVINIPGHDIFTDPAGNKIKNLKIEVPTLVWKDLSGNVVQHPECPDIDVNYQFNPSQLFQYLTALTTGMNTWAFGHTGTGKSTFIEQVAARIGWPVSRVNLDSNLERADLVGHTTLKQEGGATITCFEEGILPRAMHRPGIFLMDEIDAGRPDILFVVQRALENKGLMLTEDGGRLVQPHPLFRFAATANTRGQGDEYGMYAGTRAMNASLIDRFTAFIEFGYMSTDNETKLLQKLTPGLDPATAANIAQFAKEVRVAFTKGDVGNTISPRGLSVMAQCFVTFKSYGMKEKDALTLAMEMTALNKVPSDSRQKFTEISTRVFK